MMEAKISKSDITKSHKEEIEYPIDKSFDGTGRDQTMIVHESLDNTKQDSIYFIVERGFQLTKFTQDEFIDITYEGFRKMVSPLLNKTISALLKTIEYLEYQLDHALENLPDEIFEEISQQYLKPPIKYDNKELMRELELLMNLTSCSFEIDVISDIFNCDIEQAEQVLKLIVNQYKNLKE